MARRGALALGILLFLVAAGCGRGAEQAARPPTERSPSDQGSPGAGSAGRVDPRRGGFEVGFGEFAVTLEAEAIRPGPVTFLVHNRGELVHGFEMELEDESEDSSGPGRGGDDGFKVERPTFGPGETIRVRLGLTPGVYKVECLVANHDDLGMEAFLEVRQDAPSVRQETAGGGSRVAIEGFAFRPGTIEVTAGTEVTWTNRDPTEHTVTARDGSFGSDPFGDGQTFATTLDAAGQFAYFCSIHPSMEGTVRVTG